MEMESFYSASTAQQVNIEFLKKINELSFNFNLRYFCVSVNYLTLTELKNCLKIVTN